MNARSESGGPAFWKVYRGWEVPEAPGPTQGTGAPYEATFIASAFVAAT